MTGFYLVFSRFFSDRSDGPIAWTDRRNSTDSRETLKKDGKPLVSPRYFPGLNKVKTRDNQVQNGEMPVSLLLLIDSRRLRAGETQVFCVHAAKTMALTRYLLGVFHLIAIEFL